MLVNTPSLFGAMGYSTGVDRTFMIGTGTIGGSISSDNIGVRHLLNRKRVAAQIHDWEMPASGAERPARRRLGAQPRAGRRAEQRRGPPRPRRRPPRPHPRPRRAARRRRRPGASLEELVRQAIAAVMRDA